MVSVSTNRLILCKKRYQSYLPHRRQKVEETKDSFRLMDDVE